jgi:hypothetical protein
MLSIYSDKTKKSYDTMEKAIAAEEEYDAAQAKAKEEKQKLADEKNNRKAELKAAEQAVIDANKALAEARNRYSVLIQQYTKDYGIEKGDSEVSPFISIEDFINMIFS